MDHGGTLQSNLLSVNPDELRITPATIEEIPDNTVIEFLNKKKSNKNSNKNNNKNNNNDNESISYSTIYFDNPMLQPMDPVALLPGYSVNGAQPRIVNNDNANDNVYINYKNNYGEYDHENALTTTSVLPTWTIYDVDSGNDTGLPDCSNTHPDKEQIMLKENEFDMQGAIEQSLKDATSNRQLLPYSGDVRCANKRAISQPVPALRKNQYDPDLDIEEEVALAFTTHHATVNMDLYETHKKFMDQSLLVMPRACDPPKLPFTTTIEQLPSYTHGELTADLDDDDKKRFEIQRASTLHNIRSTAPLFLPTSDTLIGQQLAITSNVHEVLTAPAILTALPHTTLLRQVVIENMARSSDSFLYSIKYKGTEYVTRPPQLPLDMSENSIEILPIHSFIELAMTYKEMYAALSLHVSLLPNAITICDRHELRNQVYIDYHLQRIKHLIRHRFFDWNGG
jgi:hypothetical protein